MKNAIAKQFVKAAERLHTSGLHKGSLYGKGRTCCAAGACHRVDPSGDLAGVFYSFNDRHDPKDGATEGVRYNDHPDTTKGDMVLALLFLAQFAETEELA